jgi:hypothetical protein
MVGDLIDKNFVNIDDQAVDLDLYYKNKVSETPSVNLHLSRNTYTNQ